MSVGSHLQIRLDEYDSRIRTFIPGYEQMLAAAAGALHALQTASTPHIVDLGTGTGALAACCLRTVPGASVTAIDEDGEILAMAQQRLAQLGAVASFVQCSFLDVALPSCDAIVGVTAGLYPTHTHDWDLHARSDLGHLRKGDRAALVLRCLSYAPEERGQRPTTMRRALDESGLSLSDVDAVSRVVGDPSQVAVTVTSGAESEPGRAAPRPSRGCCSRTAGCSAAGPIDGGSRADAASSLRVELGTGTSSFVEIPSSGAELELERALVEVTRAPEPARP